MRSFYQRKSMRYECKDAPGFEGRYYLDPNKMEIINKTTGKPLKLRIDHCGYPEVHLSVDGKDLYRKVHRLFAEAYHQNPTCLPCVNHKDENKMNFHPENLEWCDYRYNSNYWTSRERLSTAHKGKKHLRSTNRIGDIVATDSDGNVQIFETASKASEELKISRSKINDVLCGIRKSSHGYTFSRNEREVNHS